MKPKKMLTSLAAVTTALFSMNSQANLISAGSGLVYDNVANVTWSSDANLFGTMLAGNANLVNQILAVAPTVSNTPNTYYSPSGTYTLSSADFGSGGQLDWFAAMAWTQYLNSINYLGHNTWMLPTTYDQTCSGYNCTNSMLGELFTALGGVSGYSITTTHNSSYALFNNFQTGTYWSSTEFTANPNGSWSYGYYGYQGPNSKGAVSGMYSLIALAGNASSNPIPEPGALALLSLGLAAMACAVRYRPGCAS